jgi:hypothetical protein
MSATEPRLVNPYNILTQPEQWVLFEYNCGRGSRFGLYDYAKRRKLYAVLVNRQTPQEELDAWKYLLGLDSDPEC